MNISPNGRFLVTAGDDGVVKLWDNNTGNYELLHKLDIQERITSRQYCINTSISACSKYILVSTWTHVFLIDIKNGRIINSLRFRSKDYKRKAVFSNDDQVILILCYEDNTKVINVWHAYLDDDDMDYLITLWRQTSNRVCGAQSLQFTYSFSHDNTMIAIHDVYRTNATLWSIDLDNKCLTHKSDFPGNVHDDSLVRKERLHFTPDDKYIVCNTNSGPIFWNIAGDKLTEHTMYVLGNGENTIYDPMVKSISPNNQQLVIQGSGYPSITSYNVK